MRAVRVALLDDNGAWLRRAEAILHAYGQREGVELAVSSFASGHDLLSSGAEAPDVLFSDIELGEGESGISLAEQVHDLWPSCQLAFVTNHLHYAPEVYVTEHFWFVLKDQFERRLPEVMGKLLRQMDERSMTIVLRVSAHNLVSMPCAQVEYLERRGRITNVHALGGEVYQVPDRISELMDRLPQRLFAQCHGSYVVNLGHVRKVNADSVQTGEGRQVPLSRRFSRSFKDAYLAWADEHAV